MTLNWYLDSDGTTHRLRTRDGWTETVLGEVTLPVDSVMQLGGIDGARLAAALRDATTTLESASAADLVAEGPDAPAPGTASASMAAPPEDALAPEPPRLHLCAGRRGDEETFLISGTHEDLAVLRAVPWHPASKDALFDALAEVGSTELPRPNGPTQLSVGADEDWTATLVLTGPSGPERLPLHRDPVEIPPLRHLQGEAHVSASVGTREFTALLDQIPAGDEVTLAFVPGRVLVRSGTGMVGALETRTVGNPLQGTFAVERVRSGLTGLREGEEKVSLALFREHDRPSLRIVAPGANAQFSVLPRGWRYL